MIFKLKLEWAVILAMIAAAVAWGKTQSDVSWLIKRLDVVEQKLDRLNPVGKEQHAILENFNYGNRNVAHGDFAYGNYRMGTGR